MHAWNQDNEESQRGVELRFRMKFLNDKSGADSVICTVWNIVRAKNNPFLLWRASS